MYWYSVEVVLYMLETVLYVLEVLKEYVVCCSEYWKL